MLDAASAPRRQVPGEGGVAALHKSLALLDVVERLGGASAKEVAAELGVPLPTAYRLLHTLVDHEFLVHLKDQHRYELGYALGRLGSSLHHQIGVPSQVRRSVDALHTGVEAAAYLAVVRGGDVVVTHVVDSVRHRRAEPLAFGFHEGAHATAYGKVLLSTFSTAEVEAYVARHGIPAWTADTITDRAVLVDDLARVAQRGVAWEHGEFETGTSCLATPVQDASGRVVAALSVSLPSSQMSRARAALLENALRDTAHRIGRGFRRTASRRRPGRSDR